MSSSKKSPLPFGTVLGHGPGGVPAYSSDYDSVDLKELPDRSAFRSHVNGIYTGYKWQCVEYARRWLLLNKGYVFEDIAMAYDIFRLQQVTVPESEQTLPLRSFRNGSPRHPEPGCMLIWSEGGEFQVTGHVAIVTEVTESYIRIAEQNVGHQYWTEGVDYARELPARIDNNSGYWIQCTFGDAKILGWVVQTDDDRHAETIAAPDPVLFTLQTDRVPNTGQHKQPWLNIANPDEAAYIEALGGHRLTTPEAEQYRYFRLSQTAAKELKRATNELHALFMHATDYVMQNSQLMSKFDIPEMLWPRIQQSWSNRRNEMITGRFDFCMTEQGIRLYEYNADSASCYMEAGKVQELWAEHFGCDVGNDSAPQLFGQLVHAWHDTEIDDMVHIMQDRDTEETYHALFMKSAMERAGIRCKIIKGIDSLQWLPRNSEGVSEVADKDGTPIRWVWKTWAWETALEQLRRELADEGEVVDRAAAGKPPRLMDVLLRPGVMVFEPLWTLVTSNKALLPIISEMFPEHPYLLPSSFKLTAKLEASGYVVKPIAGRCGHNVSLVEQGGEQLQATEGRFDYQQNIYQALCKLPELAGYHMQVCCFSVSGRYAGSCLRVDPSPIITQGSDLLPLRIVADYEFLEELESEEANDDN